MPHPAPPARTAVTALAAAVTRGSPYEQRDSAPVQARGMTTAPHPSGTATSGEHGTADPGTILTFGSDGVTYHPDHITIHHWVTAAWKQRRSLQAS